MKTYINSVGDRCWQSDDLYIRLTPKIGEEWALECVVDGSSENYAFSSWWEAYQFVAQLLN